MTKITIKNSRGEIIKTIDADLNRTLLKQLEEAWVEMASACFTGICGACMCQIEAGEEYIDKSFKWEPGFPLAEEEIMTCIAGVKQGDGEIILKSIY